jgi:hypothetical protein
MSTAQDIITRALRSLQVVAQGETPDADQLNDGLVSLNDLLSAWGNERLMVYQTVQETITLVGGQSAYDIGVGATSLNTSMPIRIERAFIRLNGIDSPLEILTRDQYQSIASKSDSSDIPSGLYYDTGYPESIIRLSHAPTGGTLYIDSWKPLTAFSTLGTTVSLPNGYERALRLNLAVELMPEYGVQNQMIYGLAKEAKAGIKRANHTPEVMSFDAEIPQRVTFDIQVG